MDIRSIGIYTASFLFSLLFMGLAGIFDCRDWSSEKGKLVLVRRRVLIPFFLISLCVPVLLAAIRKDVGSDFYNYQVQYREINTIQTFREFVDKSRRTDPGYMLLNMVVHRIFHREQMIFAINALLIYACFFAGIIQEHKSHSVMLGLFVFYTCFFFMSMNIIRQYIAIAMIFYAMRFLCERKGGRFFLWVMLASLFHKTAVFVFPFYFLYGNKKWNRWLKFACYIALLLLLGIFTLAPGLIVGKSVMGEVVSQAGGKSLGLGIILKRLPLFLLIGWYYPDMKARDERSEIWLSLYLISVLIYHFGYFNVVFNRMALFFEVSLIHLLPCAIRSIKCRRERTIIGLLLFFYLSIWCCQSMVIDNIGTCIPYQTIYESR